MQKRRWRRFSVSVSELYMWAGAFFAIAVIFVVEMSRRGWGLGGALGDFIVQGGATLAGVVIGAGFSYHLAHLARRDARKDAAMRLFLKVMQIANSLYSIRLGIDAFLEQANASSDTDLKMWQRVRPIMGLMQIASADLSEVAPFVEGGEDDIANRAALCITRYGVLIDQLGIYGRMREEMWTLFRPVAFSDGKVTSEVAPENTPLLEAKSYDLEQSIRAILANLREDEQEANKLVDEIGPAMARIFGEPMPTTQSNAFTEDRKRGAS